MKPNFLIVLFMAAFHFAVAQKTQTRFMAFSIPDSLTTNADAVVRLYDTEIELESQRKMIVKIKKAVTILNKKGNDNAELVFSYDKAKDIKKIDIYIYNSVGIEEKEVKNKEIKDYSAADGFSLFNDNRLKYYGHVPISYPYTIYYEYEYETSNTAFIPRWSPISSFDQSVENSTFKVIYNDNITIRKLEKNFNNFNMEVNEAPNSILFHVKNIPAIKYEDFSPSSEYILPSLLIGINKFHLEGEDGNATNWKEFGKWRYDKLYNGNDVINETTKSKVLKLVEGINDSIEKAKIIYKYVQNKMRYISVQEGIGGWKPIKADEVDKVSYGDCKGLTNYTKTLMDAVGVKTHYSVVWAGSEKESVENDFFSMQGNHIILYLPTKKGDIWLECTSQTDPFGYQGVFTDDRDVLVITPEGGIIKHTSLYKEEQNLKKTNSAYIINQEGYLTGRITIMSYGIQFAFHDMLEHETEREIMDHYKDDYWPYINNLTIKDYKFSNDKNAIVFTEDLNVTAADYAKFSGDRMLFEVNAFNKSRQVPDRYRNRKMPVEVSRGFLDEDVFTITLPEGFTIEALPDAINLKTKFGTYVATIEKISDGELKYSRRFLFHKGLYPKEDYKAFRDFLKDVSKYDNSKIVLLKNKP